MKPTRFSLFQRRNKNFKMICRVRGLTVKNVYPAAGKHFHILAMKVPESIDFLDFRLNQIFFGTYTALCENIKFLTFFRSSLNGLILRELTEIVQWKQNGFLINLLEPFLFVKFFHSLNLLSIYQILLQDFFCAN